MQRMRSGWRMGGALVAALVGACSGKDPYNPGTSLGTFHVEAKLTSLSCGGTAPDPWSFDVKMNHDGTTLYWIQGGAPIAAAVAADGHSAFSSQTVTDVRAVTPKAAGCAITRADALGMYLIDAATKPTADPAQLESFSGTLSYAYTPTEGSDCGDQLSAQGGTWQALPCAVTYELTGVRKP